MPDDQKEKKKLEIAKEELKIVRKFLRRNKLDEMYGFLQQICADLHSVKVTAGMYPVPADQKTPIPFQHVDWDSDAYFDDGEPTRLTVPTGLGGRYFVKVAVRWLNPEEAPGPPNMVIKDSYYYAFVSSNGSEHAVVTAARATANKVGHGATGTTQHFSFDLDLDSKNIEHAVRNWVDNLTVPVLKSGQGSIWFPAFHSACSKAAWAPSMLPMLTRSKSMAQPSVS